MGGVYVGGGVGMGSVSSSIMAQNRGNYFSMENEKCLMGLN